MLEKLFKNIGGKIKKLAAIAFIVEAIAAIYSGIALMFCFPDVAFIGLSTMIIGPFVAWVSSWLLYGFGQLIENSDIVVKNTQAPATRPVAQQTTTPPAAQATAPQVVPMTGENAQKPPVKPESREHGDIACPSCGHVQNQNRRVCFRCGQRFKVIEEPKGPNAQNAPVTPTETGFGIICPTCRSTQNKGTPFCYKCGQPFC